MIRGVLIAATGRFAIKRTRHGHPAARTLRSRHSRDGSGAHGALHATEPRSPFRSSPPFDGRFRKRVDPRAAVVLEWGRASKSIEPLTEREEASVMSKTQQTPWIVSLLSIAMGTLFIVGGGFMVARYFTCPVVAAEDFQASEQEGRYIQLEASEAFEVGFQIQYEPGNELTRNDPTNRVGRMVAVPAGEGLLIVLVPMDHQGRSYRGTVKELSSDIEMALSMESLSQSFEDMRLDLEAIQRETLGARPSGFSPGIATGLATTPRRSTPTLQDLALPVYLDTKEDERWAAGLMIVVGLAFAIGGVVGLSKRGQATEGVGAWSSGREALLDASRSPTFSPDGRQAPDSNSFEAEPPVSPVAEINVSCSAGHRFLVNAMYRGTLRKCPQCDEKVEIPMDIGMPADEH